MAYPEEYQEKVDTVNDTLTTVLEDYVTKRNRYKALADARYLSGPFDSMTEFPQEFTEYREAKQLLIDLMFADCTVNQMVQRLDDFDLI